MNELNYLLSASLAMAIFYALYALAFRRLRFYALNRAYLLAALVGSLLIPLVELPVPTEAVVSVPARVFFVETLAPSGRTEAPAPVTQIGPGKPAAVEWGLVGWVVYLVGVGVRAARLGIGLGRLAALARQPGRWEGGLKFIPTTGPNASFFNLVFLNETGLTAAEREQVLAHEAAHARLGHSADRLLLEALRVAFWCNPVLWLYQRSLAHLHELQVDERMAQRFDARVYAQLLLRLHGGAALPMTNLFSRQPLKDRLIALFQPKPTSNMKKLLYLAVAPVALVATLALAPPAPAPLPVSFPPTPEVPIVVPSPASKGAPAPPDAPKAKVSRPSRRKVSPASPSVQEASSSSPAPANEPAGHFDLKNGRATVYLNLNRYDPAFIETAKRFFYGIAIELNVSNVQADAFGKLLTGDLTLVTKQGGKASIHVEENDAKATDSRWVYLELHQQSGNVSAGSLPLGFRPAVTSAPPPRPSYLPRFWFFKKEEGC